MAEKRKNIFGKLNLVSRLAIIYSIIPLAIFISIATYIYISQRNKIYDDAESQMTKNLSSLIVSVMIDRNSILEKNEISLNTFKSFISSNKSFFYFDRREILVEVTNNNSGVKDNIKVKNWKFRGDTIFMNGKFMSALSLSLKSDLVISQKTKSGYVNVTSTKNSFESIYFPYSTDIVYVIENGEVYEGVLKIDGIKYFVKAAPLYINGSIQGMLMSLVENKFSSELSEIFANEIYYKRGYPFAMNLDGNMLIHPTLIGQTIIYSDLFDRINKAKDKTTPMYFDYPWPENSKGEKKIMIVQYLHELEIFVGISFFESDLKDILGNLVILLIVAVFFSTLAIVFSVITVANLFNKRLESIRKSIEKLSLGVIPKDFEKNSSSGLLNISGSEEILVKNFKKLEVFTENLKKRNYEFEYKKWSNNDKIGQNLYELNEFLYKNYKEEKVKQEEQKRLIWLNEGVSKFIEILKYQVIEIKDLAYRIISQIVEYVGANEGGFFIVSQDVKGEKYLELLAAYAMHKEKLLDRKISFGTGLVGRVAVEKKMLFLKEIPDSYSKISTALGQGKPNSIVVLPLIFNDDIIGVIELASFEVISDLQLEFLEKITENISANLAMWQASQQTAKLLRDSQEQTKLQEKQQKELEAHLQELQKLREDGEQREIELNSMIKAVDTTALLVEYDTNGTIISANSRFLETLEKKEDDLIGKHHRDITSMDTVSAEYRDFWHQLLEGQTKRFIESFALKDKTIWLSQNYVPIVDKEQRVFKILNIAIDVTENKVLERQLRAQVREISKEARTVRKEQRKVRKEREEFDTKEKAFEAVIKGIEGYIGHVEFSIDGAISFLNKKFAEIIEYDIALLNNKNIKDFVADSNIEIFKLAIEKVINGEEYSSTINLLNSFQKSVEVQYTLLPAKNIKNKVDKIIMITTKK